jgi:hypothetical protein
MNCPDCKKPIFPNTECVHFLSNFVVGYGRFSWGTHTTVVKYSKNTWDGWDGRYAIRLSGLVLLDEERIEKLLLLR